MTQQTFRCHYDERFAPGGNHLSAQTMKILRGRAGINNLDIVLGRKREKAFEPRAGMFRPHSLKTVREQKNDPRQPMPFVFCTNDKLIDDDLRGVHEIAELRLPQNQTVGAIETVAVIESENAGFGKWAVDDLNARLFR